MPGRFWGLRGSALNHATIYMIVGPAFTCFGYNQAVAGGVLTLPSFIKAFPEMNTITTTGATQQFNSKIQGAAVSLGSAIVGPIAG